MKTRFVIFMLVFLAAMFSFHRAMADEVHLKNGDRITGKLVRMEEGKLEIETAYAGKISIEWNQVARLITDEPIKVILSDDTMMQGNIVSTADDTMKLKTEKLEEPTTFNLSEVKAINPPDKPPVKITAQANLGIITQSGNTNTDQFNILAEFIARTVKSRYTLGGNLNRESADDVDTARNWLVYGRYDYFLSKKWFLNANTILENNEFADLDLRTTVGAGAGYQFFESPELNLSAGAGVAYVNENFIVADDDNYAGAQWQVNYDQYFFKKYVQLFHNQAGVLSLEDTGNWYILTRQGLRFPIYKGFTATIQYNYDYRNEPSPAAIEKYDSKLMFLLGYQIEN